MCSPILVLGALRTTSVRNQPKPDRSPTESHTTAKRQREEEGGRKKVSDVHFPVSPSWNGSGTGTKRRGVERTDAESGTSEVVLKEGKRNGTRNRSRYCFSAKKPLIWHFWRKNCRLPVVERNKEQVPSALVQENARERIREWERNTVPTVVPGIIPGTPHGMYVAA